MNVMTNPIALDVERIRGNLNRMIEQQLQQRGR